MGEIKQNKMMSGIFTKIEYKDEAMVFNGIYVVFQIENPVCDQKEKVYRNILLNRNPDPTNPCANQLISLNQDPISKTYNEIRFDITPLNYQTVSQLSQIETNIINQYNKHIKSAPSRFYQSLPMQKKHISLKHNMYNQKFKLYNDFENVKGTTHFMLKISGIWEDESHLGLTYKIMQVNPMIS